MAAWGEFPLDPVLAEDVDYILMLRRLLLGFLRLDLTPDDERLLAAFTIA